MFNEEAEQSLDEYIEETTEARREESIIFYEGCTIVTAPTGPPPEYLTVEVDTINDYNVMWRGVPTMPAVGDEVIVWENPLSHRREIWGGSGTSGTSGGASWCQVVVVAKCGGDFDDITDAIVWINALAAPPAANLLFELYVLAGNWIEGANITVPPFVTLLGMGDGTSIEMGAFDLIMDDDSNLFNVKVTFAASGSLLISSKDRVILEHVHGTQTSNDDILFVDGTSSDVECKDCWFDSAGNEAVRVVNTADVRFDNCKLEAHAGTGYAIVLDDTATVRMEWCELTAYVPVFTVAGTTFDHFSCQFDLSTSTLAAGTHTALSTKRFNQTLVVAEAGGEFTSLGAAITYINAQADAAAGKLYGVLMLTGNFAEGAPVTIPQYVTVMGMGEGTEIEMGANTLSLAADSSLENLVVESSHNTTAVQVNGVTNVFLRDVRIIQTGGVGGCLYVIGANSEVACRDVILEATSTAMFGFYAQDNGTVLSLEYCTADDSTNFTRALWIANYTVTVTARYCTFHGSTDDITLSTNATLNHFMCQFDPDNCTWQGTEVPMVTGRANFDDVVTFENGVTFDGLTTQNIITIPDTLADALYIIDDGAGDVFFRIVTTTDSEEVIFNDGGDNVDFRVEAAGATTHALFVQGSDGYVGLNEGSPDEMLHMTDTVQNEPRLKIECISDDVGAARIEFHHTSATPADGDRLGFIEWHGYNSTPVTHWYANLAARSEDVTVGSEAGRLYLEARIGGLLRSFFDCHGRRPGGAVGEGEITINEDSMDIDYRVESNADTHAFFVDASSSNIGFGAAVPGSITEWDMADEDLEFVDAHVAVSVATVEAVIEVITPTGGTGYVPIYSSYGV